VTSGGLGLYQPVTGLTGTDSYSCIWVGPSPSAGWNGIRCYYGSYSLNENLRFVLFFIIVMDSGSLKRSCARALTIAWLRIIRPTHLCLVYEREIVGPGSMTAHYCTKRRMK
jgi:hypothetical protein